jgi:hypothetical protein
VEIVNQSLLKCIHFARDAVLFTMVGISVSMYYPYFEFAYRFLSILGLDVIGLVLIVIPKDISNQLGYAWTGAMSIFLLFYLFPNIGNGYLSPGAEVIVFLAVVEILVDIKLVLDQLAKQIHEVEPL